MKWLNTQCQLKSVFHRFLSFLVLSADLLLRACLCGVFACLSNLSVIHCKWYLFIVFCHDYISATVAFTAHAMYSKDIRSHTSSFAHKDLYG